MQLFKNLSTQLVILFISIFLFNGNIWGQKAKVEDAFNAYIQSVRENRYSDFPRQFIKPENHPLLIQLAEKYVTDTMPAVRAAGYYLLRWVGTSSTKTVIRQQVVNLLLEGCKDSGSGNVSLCIDYLTQFYPKDFNNVAQDTMLVLLQRKNYYFDEYVKLCGYVLSERALPYLEKLLQGTVPLTLKEKWAIRLAMARAGDEEQTNYILQKTSQIEPNDEIIYHLLPDLVYTRQRPIFDRIIEWLNDERKLCTSSNPDREEALVCGYRIMEILAPVIKDYPYKQDVTGELLADDYDRALLEIRAWFKKNPNYIIDTSQY